MLSKLSATLVVLTSLLSFSASAQTKKMDLDDMSVKGEVHNDNRLSILARQQNKLKDYIHYRKEFRSELYQEAPKELPLKTNKPNP